MERLGDLLKRIGEITGHPVETEKTEESEMMKELRAMGVVPDDVRDEKEEAISGQFTLSMFAVRTLGMSYTQTLDADLIDLYEAFYYYVKNRERGDDK